MSSVSGPVPLDDQLCFAVYSAGIAIQRAYKPLLDELGLTYPQYLVLNVLWRGEGRTVGEIAGRLALEPSTVTPLLKRLEEAGIVRRERNPRDERQVLVAVTPEGKALEARAGCLGAALVTASGQSPSELARLNAELTQLRDALYQSVGGWSLKAGLVP